MLDLRSLSVRYGTLEVLSDVSISVSPGEFVALVGPNGAGKTTALRAVSGLVAASAGEIVYDSQPITHLSPVQIARLGICHVPEGRELFPNLTVMEHLQLGGWVKGRRQPISPRLAETLDILPHLKDRLHQKTGTLSGGEQQMVAVGRAFMSDPKVLLLDEPFLGLAPLIRKSILDAIGQIHRSGVTTVIVEQEVRSVLSVVDRGYILNSGRIRFSGETERLLAEDVQLAAYFGD